MNSKELFGEYEMLRREIYRLNQLVVKELGRLHKKASRKRIVTYTEPEKLTQIRQKQIQNNTFVLGMMSKQYNGLKVKSQTLPPKQTLERQIEQVKAQILTTKHKIASLKLKNKAIGDSIINTDQVLAQLKQCEREHEVWAKKKKLLEAKLHKVDSQTQKVLQNLDHINTQSSSADSYLKTKHQTQKQQTQQNVHLQTYHQKLHSIQILKKNHQIFSALKQQKYHQLLKLLENHLQTDSKIKSKTHSVQLTLLQFTSQVESLQKKLKEVKHQNSRLGYQQSSNICQPPQKQTGSEQQFSNQNIKPNPRLSMFIQKRDKKLSAQKLSGNQFARNELPGSAHEKGNGKVQNLEGTSEISEFRLNLSTGIQSNNSDQGDKIMQRTKVAEIQRKVPQLREEMTVDYALVKTCQQDAHELKEYQQLSGQIRSMISKKVIEPSRFNQKVSIDLQKIEQNLEKVSRSRTRVKEQIAANFSRYADLHKDMDMIEKVG